MNIKKLSLAFLLTSSLLTPIAYAMDNEESKHTYRNQQWIQQNQIAEEEKDLLLLPISYAMDNKESKGSQKQPPLIKENTLEETPKKEMRSLSAYARSFLKRSYYISHLYRGCFRIVKF
jgi:hypothetical protein